MEIEHEILSHKEKEDENISLEMIPFDTEEENDIVSDISDVTSVSDLDMGTKTWQIIILSIIHRSRIGGMATHTTFRSGNLERQFTQQPVVHLTELR